MSDWGERTLEQALAALGEGEVYCAAAAGDGAADSLQAAGEQLSQADQALAAMGAQLAQGDFRCRRDLAADGPAPGHRRAGRSPGAPA
jgi:hypothetical protein